MGNKSNPPGNARLRKRQKPKGDTKDSKKTTKKLQNQGDTQARSGSPDPTERNEPKRKAAQRSKTGTKAEKSGHPETQKKTKLNHTATEM